MKRQVERINMDSNHYFTNEELQSQLEEWAQSYPNLLRVEHLGHSYEGRPIPLAILTRQDNGVDRKKPAIWVDANIHATEITGTTTALRLLDMLLKGYGEDQRITRLVKECSFYIAPRLNPDGAAQAMADHPRYLRSGVRPYPWPEKEKGLYEEDIDGDGRILQMRIPDPNGDWKISSLDGRLMEKRGPADFDGPFYRLLPEGRIENYDGFTIKMAPDWQGLDFNRNFPFEWKPENDQVGAGPFPTSEPEIKAVADFFSNHHNINAALTYHTFSRAILRPFSTHPDEEMETEDLWVYKILGSLGSQLTGYRNVSIFHDFKYHPKEVTYGGFDDWLYDYLGIFSFTIELWDLPTQAGIKDRKFIEWFREHPHEQDLQILQWIEANAKDGYVDWHSFEHPQLGKIELGGWDSMYTWVNPPANYLGAEVELAAPLAIKLAELLPHLCMHTLQVSPLGEDQYHLNLVVENSGFLPSYTSKQAKKRKTVRPAFVELDLPEGVRLVSGLRRCELGHLEGRSNKFDLAAVDAASPTDNRARLEWVLQAPAGTRLVVQVKSERAGNLLEEVVLK
jgi:murein tripeptide amidase MpaA